MTATDFRQGVRSGTAASARADLQGDVQLSGERNVLPGQQGKWAWHLHGKLGRKCGDVGTGSTEDALTSSLQELSPRIEGLSKKYPFLCFCLCLSTTDPAPPSLLGVSYMMGGNGKDLMSLGLCWPLHTVSN